MATQRFKIEESSSMEIYDPPDYPPGDFNNNGGMSASGNTSSSSTMNQNPEEKDKISMREKLAKDRLSIALLLLLYTLQGIPLGLAGSVPVLLQAKKIGYRQQALFSLVSWPFTIKLLWAPIVDTIYSSSFGRRKSWLVPSQFCIGLMMISLSFFIDELMGEGGLDTLPNVIGLTVTFFFFHFLAATQDIAVDGWALTILSKENVGYASTCNSVGQTLGFFMSYSFFLAFHSPDFCNNYIRSVPQETGIVDMPTFMFHFGITFILVTLCIWWFKKEKKEEHIEGDRHLVTGYRHLLAVLKLPSVQTYALAVLTSKVAFAAADSVSGLKLIEAGLPAETIALIALPMIPIQVTLPWFISRFTAGPRPLDVFMKAYTPRIFMGLVFALLIWWTPRVGDNGSFPLYYYVVIIFVFLVHQVLAYSMFVSIMAFHAKISDPMIGGTYMTLLNTVSNMAGTWAGTIALWLVDNVSFKDCEGVTDLSLDCDTMQELKMCEAAGGHCVTHLDGYYVEMAICVVLGVLWVFWQRRNFSRLQSLDAADWKIR